MASPSHPDSRRNLTAAAWPPISKDVHGSDNSIPLSPQWLLSKPGEIKPETVPVDVTPYPGHPGRSDITKSWGNADDMNDMPKKKVVFRPPLLEMESGRRERWRDEERDTNSAVRKDRWRDGEKELGDTRKLDRWVENSSTRHFGDGHEERDVNPAVHKDRWRDGDKELGDNRKVDRWVENSSIRHFGDGRRGTPDRWTDSSCKDSGHDQRRESKWNTRWGPDDKETEGLHNKWIDPSKEGDIPLDKGSPSLTSNGKDEREGDYYRPWRSNSSQSRVRLEQTPHHQNHTPNKQSSTFAPGRGRGDNASATFSIGRGRIGSGSSFMNIYTHSHSLGAISDKVSGGFGEPSPLRYSRTKLLDVYRTNMRSNKGVLDEFAEVPALTLRDSLEPLALCAPTPEELVILKGIDKGDITSSGDPQVTKDGSIGRNLTDLQPRRSKPGSGEDLSSINDVRNETATDNFKVHHSNSSEGSSLEKHMQSFGFSSKTEGVHGHRVYLDKKFNAEGLSSDGASIQKVENVSISKELNMQGNSTVRPGDMWHSLPLGEHSNVAARDWREISTEFRLEASDMGCSEQQKDLNNLRGSKMVDPSHLRDEPLWLPGDPNIKRQLSGSSEREQETPKVVHPSPEELQLYYRDPQGEIQGPFSGIDIIGWFEAGYFGIDLQVRSVGAPNDFPFSSLGDVMPHLRAKARPPPGFKKHSEITDLSIRPNFSGLGKLPFGSNDLDMIKSDPRGKSCANTEAENRFLESLMSSNLSNSIDKFSSSEGVQRYHGNNSTAMLPLATEDENNLVLLAKKMSLERSRSLSAPYPYLLGRDAATMVPKSEVILDSATQHAKLVSSMIENPQQTSHSQNVDFMSVLQDLSDMTSSGVNIGASNQSNFPVQSVVDPRQDKFDLHHCQNFTPQTAFVNQPSRLQVQNQPPLTNLFGQAVDNPTGILKTENPFSSGLSQNPQLMMLQEKYLQLHLLNQQKKQEEEKQLLLQQQLLSRVLPEQHSQRFSEPSFGRLQFPAVSVGNSSVDNSQFQSLQVLRQMLPLANLPDDQVGNYLNLPPQLPQNVSYSASNETFSAHLLHQRLVNDTQQKGWGATLSKQVDETPQKDSLLSSVVMDNSGLPGTMTKSSYETLVLQKPVLASDGAPSQGILKTIEPASVTTSEVKFEPLECCVGASTANCVNEPLTLEQTNQVVLPVTSAESQQVEAEQGCDEPCKAKEVKKSDVQEGRKTSEKKSRKQKSSKTHSSLDQAKGVSKVVLSDQADTRLSNTTDTKFEPQISGGKSKSGVTPSEAMDFHSTTGFLPAAIASDAEPVEANGDSWQVGPSSGQNTNAQPGKRAWKPAPGFKAKSLLEIQQEEQRKAEVVCSEVDTYASSMSLSIPWGGVVGNSDAKTSREFQQDAGNSECLAKSENSKNLKGTKSQLNDVLGDILVKSNEKEVGVSDDSFHLPSLPVASIKLDSNDDDNFIEAKDSKKARKKAAKAKGVVVKPVVSNSSINLSVASIPIEKGKSSRSAKEEVLPALPSGPSLGDFVIWKEEPTNSPPAPAWSTDSGKPVRPTSLRDILKEQGTKGSSVQKQAQVPAPQKSQPTQAARGSAATWLPSVSPSSKGVSPGQSSSYASAQSKHKEDDDLFWGPIEQSKQESKQADFPDLANQSGWGAKNTTVKGASSGPLGRQKSFGVRPSADHSLSSSTASAHRPSLKGKRNLLNKQSEATDFRDWCESESVRLIGTKDTSFLEFCLKQTRSEAELLLVENLGLYDPNHEFIDKFLNYMELLPADVIEIAFQGRNGCRVTSFSATNVNSDNLGAGNMDGGDIAVGYEAGAKGSGKKKGKKGKKVSPAVLGFNVVSNRIMMGEIQTVDD